MLLASPPARAAPKIQATGSGAVGYTTNVFSSPDEPVEDVPPKKGDALTVLSPGVAAVFYTPGETHRASYTFTATLFATTPSAHGFGNRLEWESLFELDPRLDLSLTASAAQDHHHTDNTFSNVTATSVRAMFPGTGRFILTRFGEALRYEISPYWRSRQASALALNAPFFESGTVSFTWANSAGVERVWPSDALGPEFRADYASVSQTVDREGVPQGSRRELIAEALMQWRHDFGRSFTSRADAGVVRVYRLSQGADFTDATYAATLGYARRDGFASLSYRHGVSTNLYLAQTLLVDHVALHAALPLDAEDRFWVGSTAGLQLGHILDTEGRTATSLRVYLGDVGLAWQLEDELRLGLRYQYMRQDSDASLPPLPLSFVRHSVMLTATIELPRERDMPGRFRPGMRVDRSDELRDDLDRPIDQPAGVTRF